MKPVTNFGGNCDSIHGTLQVNIHQNQVWGGLLNTAKSLIPGGGNGWNGVAGSNEPAFDVAGHDGFLFYDQNLGLRSSHVSSPQPSRTIRLRCWPNRAAPARRRARYLERKF